MPSRSVSNFSRVNISSTPSSTVNSSIHANATTDHGGFRLHNSTSSVYTSTEIIEMTSLSSTILISLIANSVVAWVLHNRQSNSAISKFLRSLIYSNLAITCVLPFHLFAVVNHTTFMQLFPCGSERTKLFFLVFETFIRASWLTVAVISVERYRALFPTPGAKTGHFSRTGQYCCVFFVWALSFLPTLTLVFVAPICYSKRRGIFTMDEKLYSGLAVFHACYFVLPLLVMTFCWGRIFILAASKRLRIQLGAIEPHSESVANGGETAAPSVTSGALARFSIGRCSRDAISINSTSGASTGHRPSIPTTFVYNKSFKALRTVGLVVGSFIITVGPYIVSLLMECFDASGTYRDHWIHPAGFCLLCWSFAAYPLVYGSVVRTIRNDIHKLIRRRSVDRAGLPPRPGSVSSMLFTYAPRQVNSRRPSHDDALGSRRRSSSSSDTYSDSSSIFANFFTTRAARRRTSAPCRLQNSVTENQ